jgi:GntR family transcriptional regulator
MTQLDKSITHTPTGVEDPAMAFALHRTELPLYLAAAALLRGRIERGEWKVGEKLPSIEQLAQQIPVARLTLRQALACLEKDGIVTCRHGLGTFVLRDVSHQRRLRVATDWHSLVTAITEGTSSTMPPLANPPARPHLSPGEGKAAPAYQYFRRITSKDGLPYQYMTYHLAHHVFDLDPLGFATGPILPRLAMIHGLRVSSARQTMVISSSDVVASELLHIPLASPVVLARRVVIDDKGVAIFVNDITYRGDSIRFELDLLPGSPFRAARKSPSQRRQSR